MALCWAILIGEWLHEQIPLKIKKHRRIKNGCNWCDLPKDLPPYSTVFWHYKQWRESGVIEKIRDVLHSQVRQQVKKKALRDNFNNH